MCESAQEKGSMVGWKLLCDASFGSWGLFACLSGSLSAWSCIRGEQTVFCFKTTWDKHSENVFIEKGNNSTMPKKWLFYTQ